MLYSNNPVALFHVLLLLICCWLVHLHKGTKEMINKLEFTATILVTFYIIFKAKTM